MVGAEDHEIFADRDRLDLARLHAEDDAAESLVMAGGRACKLTLKPFTPATCRRGWRAMTSRAMFCLSRLAAWAASTAFSVDDHRGLHLGGQREGALVCVVEVRDLGIA